MSAWAEYDEKGLFANANNVCVKHSLFGFSLDFLSERIYDHLIEIDLFYFHFILLFRKRKGQFLL